ncbi:hypothetical protein [Mucilaginibacter lacusdianchii]|uniref:hypothetical protein n=1 Tax=Mucilaginibacter lacusdianchii TaxID=2684211 RepID=UPI00131B955D|nr:hypothetical protein [Mucilaginibacter sp. JXJ CY 39]
MTSMELANIRTYFLAKKWPSLFLSALYFLFSLLLIFLLPSANAHKPASKDQVYAKTVKSTLKRIGSTLRRDRVASASRKEVDLCVGLVAMISTWFLIYLNVSAETQAESLFAFKNPPLWSQCSYVLNCSWLI